MINDPDADNRLDSARLRPTGDVDLWGATPGVSEIDKLDCREFIAPRE